MWNNITTYVGTRAGMDGLNSIYMNLIGNKDANTRVSEVHAHIHIHIS